MNFVKGLDAFGVPAKEIPCVVGQGEPTVDTVGAVGTLYMDEVTGSIYKCVSATVGNYIWISAEGTRVQLSVWEEDD